MAAIAANNVTYSVTKTKKMEDGRKIVNFTVAFGNGTLTYPANGVPLTNSSFACPNVVDSFEILGLQGAGYSAQWDPNHTSIRLFETGPATSGVLGEVSTSTAPSATTLNVVAIGY